MEHGTQLGHYTVLSEIGRGGMGVVWKAKDEKLGREVAIKTLPPEFAQDADRLARFEREAKLLASLNHPNIAAIYGLEEHGGTRFLVLELVEGDTLADRLRQGAIPIEESLRLALQIADALKAAHEKGVIHRDLKPANIKITGEDIIKVLDFGLAKAFAAEETEVSPSNSPTLSMQATRQGMILGTAAYMSPEQAKGRAVDRRADVWAFGCVLYEMLSGRQSFGKSDVTESLSAVISLQPEWTALPANLHPRLREVLERCLEKKIAERFQDIGDVKVEIQKALADPAGLIVQPVSETVQPTPQSRRPWVIAGLTASIAALVASVAAWNLKPSDPGPVVRLGIVIPAEQSPAPLPSVLDLSRDGARVAYVGAGNSQVFLRNLDETEARPIQGATAPLLGIPAFSPDGDWIAYMATGIRKVPVTGGSPQTVMDPAAAVSLYWDERDMLLFADQPGEGIWQVPASGSGTAELIVPAANGETLSNPRLLPDGDSILFTATTATGADRWDAGQIFVYSLASGERTLVWSGGSDARYVSTGHIVYAQGDSLFGIAFDLDRLQVTSNSPTRLVEGIIHSPQAPIWDTGQYAVSDSGSLIYLSGEGTALFGVTDEEASLVTVSLDGSIEPLAADPRAYRLPRVSPDGTRIAVEVVDAGSGETHVWIVDVATGIGDQLTFEGALNQNPLWSADSRTVIFRSDRLTGSPNAIFRQSASGEGAAEVVLEQDTEVVPTDLSADGILAFLRLGGVGADIWTVDLEEPGSAEEFLATALGATALGASEARFSPDGRWLAYSSSESGQPRVYVRPYPRVDDTQRQLSDRSIMFSPVWSPTMDELYAVEVSGSLTGLQITATPVRTEPEFSVAGRPRQQFDALSLGLVASDAGAWTPAYDIMPDGDRFVFVAASTGPASTEPVAAQINVVLNWTQELVERVPVE